MLTYFFTCISYFLRDLFGIYVPVLYYSFLDAQCRKYQHLEEREILMDILFL